MDSFVEIRVSEIVKQFYCNVNNSDTIPVKRHDEIGVVLYPLLQLVPSDYKPMGEGNNFIRFELFRSGDCFVQNRNFLDENSQKIVSGHLLDIMKKIFHNYVLGYVKAGGIQKEGIIEFCEDYDLNWSNTTFEMLKKSWDRSIEKSRLKNKLKNLSS